MAAALQGKAEDASEAAALKFASAVVEKRGRIDDADFKAITDAGFTPGEVSEIVAHVVVNTFSNYFNNVARTEIDFHLADESKGAQPRAGRLGQTSAPHERFNFVNEQT